MYQKENGFAGNVKHLKINLLKWFVKNKNLKKIESFKNSILNVRKLWHSFQKCELCPSKDGALKPTENGNWAHVVCALYIPEVTFMDVTTMEPVKLSAIPRDRFNRVNNINLPSTNYFWS